MFNEKNIPKLILLTPIVLMICLVFMVTYLFTVEFTTIREIQNSVLFVLCILFLASVVAFVFSTQIVSVFNRYKKDLEQNKQTLIQTNEHLEQRIKNKTKKLEEFNKQLESKVNQEVLKNRQKDSMLFQQTKSAAIGEMLENIAHQWRQPLSAISSSASGMALKIEYALFNQDEAKADLNKIVETTKKLSLTIDEFQKYFSKSQTLEDFNVSDIIKSNLLILDASIKNNHIDVVLHIKDDLTIFGLKNEFSQALLSILNNAQESLLQHVDVKYKRLIGIDLYKKEQQTIIDIYDNAGGVDETIIDKIFEPYFTTKHKSQGTGLGLYLTNEIITRHLKGNLSVQNINFVHDGSDYKGALFRIALLIQEHSN
jgi:C4-dicarboxylate-specific signal transduction histidine kinase